MTDKHISETLKFVGQNREVFVDWIRQMLDTSYECQNKFVMMDSTHFTTVSEQLGINAKGYKPAYSFGEQTDRFMCFQLNQNSRILPFGQWKHQRY